MVERHKTHSYQVKVEWTGNTGTGTSTYRGYERAHEISAPGKPVIYGSSDPAFRGEAARYNPEELLVAALSTCHMLWYLHLCADNKIIVTGYVDQPRGQMRETDDGGGRFVAVVLQPEVTIKGEADPALLESLHAQAHHLCFIANSVNFPVTCESRTRFE